MTERSEIDRLCQEYSDAYDKRLERYRRHIRFIDDTLRYVAGMLIVLCAAWLITRIFTP